MVLVFSCFMLTIATLFFQFSQALNSNETHCWFLILLVANRKVLINSTNGGFYSIVFTVVINIILHGSVPNVKKADRS